MIWDNLREEEFEGAIEKSGGLCVIPIGCTEKHGQHLPVGTDYMEAITIVKEAAKLEDVVILPVGAWLGEVSCFHSFKDPGAVKLRGCIGIKQSTILTVLEELCDEAARNGFRKVLLVSNHGGNGPILSHFLRCQSYEPKPYATMVTYASPGNIMDPKYIYSHITENKEKFPELTDEDMKVLEKLAETGYGGGHGHFKETAIVMSYDESLVDKTRYDAEDGLSNHRTDYLREAGVQMTNDWLANYPTSYSGYPPFGCSKAIGDAFVKICAERLAGVFKLIKEDEDCVRSAQMLPKE